MYQSPYSYPNMYQQYMPQQTNHSQIIKVNGKNGVDAYQMAPNSSALLLDETAPIVWLAQTDGAGYKTATAYDIALHQELPPVDTRALEQRIIKLEEALKSYESNTTSNQRKQYDDTNRTSQTTGQVHK